MVAPWHHRARARGPKKLGEDECDSLCQQSTAAGTRWASPRVPLRLVAVHVYHSASRSAVAHRSPCAHRHTENTHPGGSRSMWKHAAKAATRPPFFVEHWKDALRCGALSSRLSHVYRHHRCKSQLRQPSWQRDSHHGKAAPAARLPNVHPDLTGAYVYPAQATCAGCRPLLSGYSW